MVHPSRVVDSRKRLGGKSPNQLEGNIHPPESAEKCDPSATAASTGGHLKSFYFLPPIFSHIFLGEEGNGGAPGMAL